MNEWNTKVGESAWQAFFKDLTICAEKAMAPHSSTLAWKIPCTEEPGGLQSMGPLKVGHDWVTSLSLFTFMRWRRKWQPTPVFLPGESQGRGSLVGCRLWGRTESDTTEAAAAATICAYMLNCFRCVWLCNPVDHSPQGSSIRGILQARILEWVAMPSSRRSFQPRDQRHVSYVSWIGRWVLYY